MEPDKDSLGLGTDSNAVGAPTQWLVVLGERGAGKTTLIRQLKVSHDGFDETEAARFSREVHKLVTFLFKQILLEVRMPDEHLMSAERVRNLKRRATITPEIAADLKIVWIHALAQDQPEDAQMRKAAGHFFDRLDDLASADFVPEALDLQHLAIPTVGQQETRIAGFPGDQICIYESNAELRRSSMNTIASGIFQGRASVRQAELFGSGVRAIVFVASAANFEDPNAPHEASTHVPTTNSVRRASDDKKVHLPASWMPPPKVEATKEPRVSSCPAYDSGRAAAAVLVPADTLKQWHSAQAIAKEKGVPCLLVLSKCDLLAKMPLPSGLSPMAVEMALRAQFFASSVVSTVETGHSKLPEGRRGTLVGTFPSTKDFATTHTDEAAEAEKLVQAAYTAKSRCVNLLDDTEAHSSVLASEMLMRQAFPELEGEEDVVGLEQAIYLCLGSFCPSDSTMLSKCGVVPMAKWKAGVLSVQDHVWLHELPRSLPNPLTASVDAATMARLGKGSHDDTRASFWAALCSLSEQLGSFEPQSLGVLHGAPLLTSGGALFVFIRSAFDSEPPMGTNRPRHLAWRTTSRVAAKMSGVAHAAEMAIDEAVQGGDASYAAQARELVAMTPSRDLSPRIWIDKLCAAAVKEAPATDGKSGHGGGQLESPLRPGTYMVAFYTQSTKSGFRVLLPQRGPGWLPPYVKISDAPLSSADWSQLCDLEEGLTKGKTAKVPKNWADAKNWMGPEVVSETHLSIVQKFFYGVIALRQQLEVKCSATKEELRYSSVSGAAESLESLGTLHKSEIVLAEPQGKVQLLLVCKHYELGDADAFPSTLQWQPFSVFEARHFNSFAPKVLQKVGLAKDLSLEAQFLHTALYSLHVSHLRGSGGSEQDSSMRSSCAPRSSSYVPNLGDADPAAIAATAELRALELASLPAFDSAEEEKTLREAWDAIRWTRRLVLSTCVQSQMHSSDWNMGRGLSAALGSVASGNAKKNVESPQQRLAEHVESHRKVIGNLEKCIERLRRSVAQLEAASSGKADAAAKK